MPQKISKNKISKEVIDFFKLTHDKNFERAVLKIRKKYQINPNKPFIQNPLNQKISNGLSLISRDSAIKRLSKIIEMQKEIFSLLKRFNLTDNWFSAVFDFICFNNRLVNDNFEYRGFSYTKPKTASLSLYLNKDATLDEIIAKWPKIEKRLKNLPGHNSKKRNKPSKNFIRNLKISYLKELNFTPKEIIQKIIDEYGDTLSEAEIHSIVLKNKKIIP